ncbi:hypothetical protein ARHIZOSPH14_12940 [Agromyces rhizosphaerae]|uniref:Uncharacterized protein n=1 Tax=Agromyces rhizosphaerae TaxID=88374 RepID=A0A9W6CXI3_9MICO|nr:hypothetical protein [Agromyces rhizosphaerae]GLI27052.1 hypothetical protein ARHIZOSPH14_12940 [Agromyces rhizosphaerae]
MFYGVNGFVFVLVYLVMFAVAAGALYIVVRLAVQHALRAHTRWLEERATE